MKRSFMGKFVLAASAILALAGPTVAETTSKNPDLTSIANDVRAAAKIDAETARAILFSFMAPTVTFSMVPPGSKGMSNILSATTIVLGTSTENDAARKRMDDFKFTMSKVEVQGDEIHTTTLSAGTLPDGQKLHLDLVCIYKFENGKITTFTERPSDYAEVEKLMGLIKPEMDKVNEVVKADMEKLNKSAK